MFASTIQHGGRDLWVLTRGLLGFIIAAIVSGILAAYVIVGLASELASYVSFSASSLRALVTHWLGLPFLICVMAIIGCIAFAVRQRAPDVYGGIEIGFGAVTACLAFQQLVLAISGKSSEVATPSSATHVFALFGSLYVVVRGLDNLGRDIISEEFPEGKFKRAWIYCFDPKKPRSAERQEPKL